MTPVNYKRIVLQERPEADITPTTFQTEILPFNLKPGHGEALVQVTWLSIEPAMRGWLRDAPNYVPPVQIGETMRAAALGVVVEPGPGSKFVIGDNVTGVLGMTEYAVVPDNVLRKLEIPRGIEAVDFLYTLGISGFTAYFGLRDVGRLRAGETLLVSGAAGSVGSLVCQLGKRAGAKVFGLAGSADKCDWLVVQLGVDAALNYKSPTFKDDFKKIGCLDVFFDNVGGEILDLALTMLNKDARIVLCGAISQYNATEPAGLQNYLNLVAQRASIQGFVVFDYANRYPEAIKELTNGLMDGTIKRKFHFVPGGLEEAPRALPLLFNSWNTGKLVVQVTSGPLPRL